MSEKSEFTPAAILGGTVEEVSAKIGALSAGSLILLLDAEKGDDGEQRKGVIEAVEAEQTARTDLAKEQISAAVEAAEHAGIFIAVFTDENDFEEPGLSEHLKTRVAELETAIAAKDEAAATAAPKAKKPKKQRKLVVTDKAIPLIDALAFVGPNGRTIADLPDLPVKPSDLKNEFGGKTLMKRIEFPETPGGKTPLKSIFALDANGKAIAECKLIADFPIGGAGTAIIAPGSLHFASWPKSEG